MREKVLEYDQATLKWGQATMLTSHDKGVAPMDIDRVQAKGKKGKGKTKDGKSKGKERVPKAAKVKEIRQKGL